eukprot:CAMPEP_0174374590 /NCGR_PEP_ID=MMETSP0811_2-20130205/111441_1 /TAXON_ID=73025 ORGANISM="Eutreptiella gymnastica-like, Strain CCMP1594" /NCGR_SAMPLE_ID=MMETSP0811_2 /ASSEMBLY_ACC=CAM_ASM_000667 /LENGTH=46 /DNA_ID= /DNA_START= /DNA_END= /DNA_ORIENTATION=
MRSQYMDMASAKPLTWPRGRGLQAATVGYDLGEDAVDVDGEAIVTA